MTIVVHISETGHVAVADICNYLLPLPISYPLALGPHVFTITISH